MGTPAVELTVRADQALQQDLLGPNPEHPATNNLNLIGALVAKLTPEGGRVLDPMAGTGTTGLLAARAGRIALCVDIEFIYRDQAEAAWRRIKEQESLIPYGSFDYEIADAREFRLSAKKRADAVIFSPPFMDSLPSDSRDPAYWDRFFDEQSKKRGGRAYTATKKHHSRTYGSHQHNLGRKLVYEDWLVEMARVYRCCAANVKPGGHVAIVLRDLARGGKVTPVVEDTKALLGLVGTPVIEDLTRPLTHLSIWTRMRKQNGQPVIEEERVLIARRPE